MTENDVIVPVPTPVTPAIGSDTVKADLLVLVGIISTFEGVLPATAKPTVDTILNVVNMAVNNPWALELITAVLNNYLPGTVQHKDLQQVIAHAVLKANKTNLI